MSGIFQTFACEIKTVDSEAGIYEAMVSTESEDRDGDVLEASGAIIENYLKNPVILFGHNYHSPEAVVARALSVEVIPGVGLKKTIQFLERGISKSADLVHDLFRAGFLRAFSVGFIPKLWERRAGADSKLVRGLLHKQWELLESSIVTIPSNPNALALRAYAEGRGYSKDQIDAVLKQGRVLSAKNEGKLRSALGLLEQVLNTLDSDKDSDKDSDDSKKMWEDVSGLVEPVVSNNSVYNVGKIIELHEENHDKISEEDSDPVLESAHNNDSENDETDGLDSEVSDADIELISEQLHQSVNALREILT